MPQNPDLPAEPRSGDPEMVALLAALSQVNPIQNTYLKVCWVLAICQQMLVNKSRIQVCMLQVHVFSSVGVQDQGKNCEIK